MAKPPEPLEQMLPLAHTVIVAEVAAVTGGEATVRPARGSLPVGAAPTLPEQQVRLRVQETLRGTASGEILAIKPAGAYRRAAGHHGPFLLDATQPTPYIIGRYGPDSYSLGQLRHAIEGAKP